jgi:hypothetical protein
MVHFLAMFDHYQEFNILTFGSVLGLLVTVDPFLIVSFYSPFSQDYNILKYTGLFDL